MKRPLQRTSLVPAKRFAPASAVQAPLPIFSLFADWRASLGVLLSSEVVGRRVPVEFAVAMVLLDQIFA